MLTPEGLQYLQKMKNMSNLALWFWTKIEEEILVVKNKRKKGSSTESGIEPVIKDTYLQMENVYFTPR